MIISWKLELQVICYYYNMLYNINDEYLLYSDIDASLLYIYKLSLRFKKINDNCHQLL